MNPLIWIPVTVVVMYFNMWISFKCQLNPEDKWFWFKCNWLLLCCTPIWGLMAVYTKNMILDALLFDIVVCVSCTVLAIYFSKQNNISINYMQWVGIGMMCLGLIVFKLADVLVRP